MTLRRLALALALSSPLWFLGHALWEVDDARYAEVPREMLESGRWLTPTLNYFEYLEKPPLIYWLGAASYRAFGVSEAAARLPMAMLAILTLAGTWWLGSWLLAAETGPLAALILASSIQFFLLGHMITPDMAVSAFLLWATALILKAVHEPSNARWAGAGAWACMALAVLSKGLIGVLLPAAWALALAVLWPARRKALLRAFAGPGLLLFAASLGAWFMIMEREHPGFFHLFVIEQHFKRFLTAQYNRPGPWYYFLPVIVGGMLPWTPLAAAGCAAAAKPGPGKEKLRQLGLWILMVFGFFSVSKSKLPTYILPLFPHLALLAAERIRTSPGPRAPALRRALLTLSCLFAAAAALSPARARLPALAALMGAPSAAAASAGLLLLAASEGFLLSSAGVFRAGALALCGEAMLILAASGMEGLLSSRPLSLAVLERARAAEGRGSPPRIVAYDNYPQGIAFYARTPVDLANWAGEFRHLQNDPRFSQRFLDDTFIRGLPTPGRTTLVMAPSGQLTRLAGLARGSMTSVDLIGPWALLEFSARN